MAKDESLHEAALRRVAEQQARVARQQKMVAALRAHGVGAYAASQRLQSMEDTLMAMRASLSRQIGRYINVAWGCRQSPGSDETGPRNPSPSRARTAQEPLRSGRLGHN